jgi:hypothetical protein
VVITDTIPLSPSHHLDRIKVLSVAPLIGEAIMRIHRGESVGALFSADAQRMQAMPLWVDREAPEVAAALVGQRTSLPGDDGEQVP